MKCLRSVAYVLRVISPAQAFPTRSQHGVPLKCCRSSPKFKDQTNPRNFHDMGKSIEKSFRILAGGFKPSE